MQMTVGQTACELSEWLSEVSVMCKAASGVAASLTFEVTLGNRVAFLSSAVSYDIPALFLSNGSATNESATNLFPAGGMVWTLNPHSNPCTLNPVFCALNPKP